ncbi:MAG TPA: acyltransferase [Acidobacteriaceae bacterium]|nr:acyltransferase [Acidobacteriaceae bacterium]
MNTSLHSHQAPAPVDAQSSAFARRPNLPALTGLRALLALGILFFHFTPPHMQVLYPVIDSAYVFVGFFFLLSGFVLAYNYTDWPTPLLKREFWRARFARVYPVFLLSLAVSFTMLQAEWHVRSHRDFFAGLILTPLLLEGWSPALATFWNTVAWTLSAELLLYATFPWLIRLPWPKSPTRLIALLVALWALGLVPHSLYILLNPDHLTAPANRYSSGYWIRALKYTPMAYACTFLIGVALGKLQAGLQLTPRQRTLIAAASLIALAAFYARAVSHMPYILMHGGLMLPLFAALMLGLSGPNPISRVFTWWPLMMLGQASYCLFLLHFNFINMLRIYHVVERLHLAALDPWITYAATILLAFAALHLVEEPARKAILRRRVTAGERSLPISQSKTR